MNTCAVKPQVVRYLSQLAANTLQPMPKMVSPAATILARTRTRATLLRRAALSLSIGLTSGLLALHHQQPLRFDTVPATTTTAQARSLASDHEPRRKELLDADTVKQLSGGSLSGPCLLFLPAHPSIYLVTACNNHRTEMAKLMSNGVHRLLRRAAGKRLLEDARPDRRHRHGDPLGMAPWTLSYLV